MAKPLDAIKSTSFFDRVDNIESTGPASNTNTSTKPKSKVTKSNKKEESTGGSGKQQTLFSLKSAPMSKPGLGPTESIAMTETDPDESMDNMEESEEMQEAQGVITQSPVCLYFPMEDDGVFCNLC